jgi:hypothetical protein
MNALTKDDLISKAEVLELIRTTAQTHRATANDLKSKGHNDEARVWSKMAECLGHVANRIETECAATIERDLRVHIAETVTEERKRLRIALRQVAEDSDRSERERELLLDLVEALGGEAAS